MITTTVSIGMGVIAQRLKLISATDWIFILIIIALIIIVIYQHLKFKEESNNWKINKKKLEDKNLELQKININNSQIEINNSGNSIKISSNAIKDKDVINGLQQLQGSLQTVTDDDMDPSQ